MDDRNNGKANEIFIGIRADSSLQDRFQRFIAGLPAGSVDGLGLELLRIGKYWYAGSRIRGSLGLEEIFALSLKVRHRLVEAMPEFRFQETQFRILAAPDLVPGVMDPSPDDDLNGDEESY